MDSRIVIGTQWLDLRVNQTDLAVIPRHVVRNEINGDLESGIVTSLQQGFELIHPFGRIVSKIWIYIVVICDRIRRPGSTFDNLAVGCRAPFCRDRCGVPDHTCVPNVADSQRFEIRHRLGIELRELSLSPQPRENLIDDHFTHN